MVSGRYVTCFGKGGALSSLSIQILSIAVFKSLVHLCLSLFHFPESKLERKKQVNIPTQTKEPERERVLSEAAKYKFHSNDFN